MYKNADRNLNFLDVSRPRKIIISSQPFYTEEILHPDRIMTCHDLFVMIDGNWDVVQEDVKYDVSVNDAIFLFAGLHHFGATRCPKNTRTVFVHFEALDTDYYGQASNNPNLVPFPTKVPCQYSHDIQKYCIEIANLFWSSNPMKEQIMDSYARIIFYMLNKIWTEGQNTVSNDMIKLIAIVNSNLGKFYSLEELAQLSFFCKRTIISMFKKYMNTTPHQFQLNMKLDLCYSRLSNEPSTLIKQLANEYGFSDEYHLSRKFKERFGISPIKIKKRSSNKSA